MSSRGFQSQPTSRNLLAGLIAFERLLHSPRNQLVSAQLGVGFQRVKHPEESCLDESWYLLTRWTALLRVFSELHVSRVR